MGGDFASCTVVVFGRRDPSAIGKFKCDCNDRNYGTRLSLRIAILAVAHEVVYACVRYVVAPGSPGKDRL